MNRPGDNGQALLDILHDDLVKTRNMIHTTDTQFGRRAFVRALFALVEASIFSMKATAYYYATNMDIATFNEAELGFMRDRAYELKENGIVRETTAKIRLESNVKFTFKVSSRVFGLDFALDTMGEGYKAFQAAVDIRDRITHPKFVEQMHITDDELVLLNEASAWIWEHTIALMRLSNDAIRDWLINRTKEAVLSRKSIEMIQQESSLTQEQAEKVVHNTAISLLKHWWPQDADFDRLIGEHGLKPYTES